MQKSFQNRLYYLLRWSEKYTKTDMIYLTSGGFWLTVGYIVQAITGLLLATALANLLPKETYGTYQYLLSAAAIIGVFTLTGIGSAVARSAAQGATSALRYAFRTQLMWSIGTITVGVSLAAYYFFQGNSLLGWSFVIVTAMQPLISGFSLYRSYLNGTKRFREGVLLEIVQRIIPFGALLATIFFTTNVLVIIGVYFVSQAVSLSIAYVVTIMRYRLPADPVPGLATYGKHLSVMESLNEIAAAADKALVWIFLGAAPTAAYALALLPVVHLQTIFGFVRQLAFPKLVMRDLGELRMLLPQKIRVYFFAACASVAAYVIAAPFLFRALFPAYPEAIPLSQLLALSLLAVPRSLIVQTFVAHRMTKELYVVNFSVPIVRIVSVGLGILFFGLWGAASGLLVAEGYAAILQWFLFRRIR